MNAPTDATIAPAVHVPVSERTRAVAARSQVYQLFGQLFIYPRAAGQQQFVHAGALEQLRRVRALLPYRVDAFHTLQAPPPDPDLPVTYTRLFDNCTGRSLMSLNEKDHLGEPAQSIWEDLIRFYEHFGIRYELGVNKEWPDWIGIELEFMHYLAALEVAATSEADARNFIAAQADFIDRHLARWVPRLCEALQKNTANTVYGAWAEALGAFVQAEQQFNRQRRPLAQAA